MDRSNPPPYPTMADLESALQEGIQSGCLFSYILSCLNRRIDETAEAIAYVSLSPNRKAWSLVVNPILFSQIYETRSKEPRERVLRAILIHEFLHLAHDHFDRGLTLLKSYSLETLNIAADLAVNGCRKHGELSVLEEIGGLFPDRPPFDFPVRLSMEQYLALLPKTKGCMLVSVPKWLSGFSQTMEELQGLSDNGTPYEGSVYASIRDLASSATLELKKRIGELMQGLQKKPSSDLRSRGFGRGEDVWVTDWVFPRVKNTWMRHLRNVLTGSGSGVANTRSYRRPHRREGGGILLKVNISSQKEQTLIILDTSGSMMAADYELFMGLIKTLNSDARSFYVMQWDYEQQTEPVPVTVFMAKKKPEFHGRGGTDMQQAVLVASQRYPQYKKMVVVTDGGTPYFTKDDPSPVPVIWVLTHNAPFNNADGVVVRLREDRDT